MGNIGRQLALVRNWNHFYKSACIEVMLVSYMPGLPRRPLEVYTRMWIPLKGYLPVFFFFFFSSMNINSFRRSPIRTEESWFHQASAKMTVFAPT